MGHFNYSPANGTKVDLNTPTNFYVEYTPNDVCDCEITLMLCTSSGKILREKTNTSGGSDTHFYNIVPSTFGEYVSSGTPSYLTFSGWFWYPSYPDELIPLADIPRYPIVQYEQCNAPKYVTVASATAVPGTSVKLSWSDAYYGIDSGIKGYEIYRATSVDGTYSLLTTIPSTVVSGSTYVDAPATEGVSYYYKVKTISATSGKDSDLSTAYAKLTAMNPTPCDAPTDCAVDDTLSLIATTLRWSGATSGVGNNISRYEIQRRSRTHKGEWSPWSALEITSGTSLSVSPPATAGHYYQYQVRAQGTIKEESLYSDWKESTNTLRKAHQTVPAFTDPTLIVGQTDVKAVHITELQSALNNILLPFMDTEKVTFTELDRDSDAKHWGAHVQELRNAIDSTGVIHDPWIAMQDEVTADVIEQIRKIIRSM